MTMQRRSALALLGGAVFAPAPRAQAVDPSGRHYAAVSLVGDELEIVYANPSTGSNLDRNVRKPMPDADASFDKIALLAMQEEIKRSERGARVTLLGLPPSRLHREPERLFDGDVIVLPGSLVDAITQAQATHVLLLTKLRGETKVQTQGGPIGYGSLRGLGYYVDNSTSFRMVESGETGRGVLAPFVYVRLTLADARTGAIVGQRTLSASRSRPVAISTTGSADPWEALAPQQKFDALSALLRSELRREIPELIASTK